MAVSIQTNFRKQNYYYFKTLKKMATYKNPHGDDFFYKSGRGFADLYNSVIRGISNNKDIVLTVIKKYSRYHF